MIVLTLAKLAEFQARLFDSRCLGNTMLAAPGLRSSQSQLIFFRSTFQISSFLEI